MPGEQHLQTDLRIGGAVSARKLNAAMREVEILSRLRAGPGIQITRSRSGMSIAATRQEGGRGGRGSGQPGGIPLVAFVLQYQGVFGDHIRCDSLDGEQTDVIILKEELVRQSIQGTELVRRGNRIVIEEDSEGTTSHLGNQSVFARAAEGPDVEYWAVLPSWETSDIIWAAPIRENDQRTLPGSDGPGEVLDGDGVPVLNPDGTIRRESSGAVKPEWIEVRGRWWAAFRGVDVIT